MNEETWVRPTGFHFFDMLDSSAIFIECPGKTFLIQTEPGIGERLQNAQEKKRGDRPKTHELLADLCTALGVKVAHVAFTDVKDGVFFTIVSLEMENELGKKYIELDARPSDALALALAERAPILISKKMLARCDDATALMKRMHRAEKNA